MAAPLTDESPPPPFSPQRQLPYPSSPAHSGSFDANINLEHKSPTAQQLYVQPQQRLSRLQSSVVLHPEPSLSLYSEPSSRSRRPSNPNCLQGYNSNQTASFTPQTMQAPRINVDLSMVYGKALRSLQFEILHPHRYPMCPSSISKLAVLNAPHKGISLILVARQSLPISDRHIQRQLRINWRKAAIVVRQISDCYYLDN